MVDLLIVVLLLGLAGTYFLRCLILERKIDHEGPFKNSRLRVVFPETAEQPEHVQAVALFDYLRLPFGVYKRVGDFWVVQYDRAERFTCPFCLSFWTTFLFSIPYVLIYGVDPVLWVPVHLGTAVVSQITYKYLYEENNG